MSREDGQGTHEILLRFRLDREGVMVKVKRPSAARGHCLPNRHVRSMPQPAATYSRQAGRRALLELEARSTLEHWGL